jgi:hypothetical protein
MGIVADMITVAITIKPRQRISINRELLARLAET